MGQKKTVIHYSYKTKRCNQITDTGLCARLQFKNTFKVKNDLLCRCTHSTTLQDASLSAVYASSSRSEGSHQEEVGGVEKMLSLGGNFTIVLYVKQNRGTTSQ